MSKEQYIKILILLSQMEGFLLGKIGANTFPDFMEEEIGEVCDLLAQHIRGELNESK